MRTARPDDDRKLSLGGNFASNESLDRATSDNCARVTLERRRDIKSFDPAKQTMQLVAIQIADKVRRIQQRPRPTLQQRDR